MGNTKKSARNRLETYFNTTDGKILGWHEFTEATGIIPDLIGRCGDMTITGSANVADESIGIASRFAGAGDYAMVGGPSTAVQELIHNSNTDGFALSIWTKPVSVASEQVVVSQEDAAGTGQNWLSFCKPGGVIGDEIATDLGGTATYSGAVAVINQWYNVIINYTAVQAPDTYGRLAIWVNGVMINNAMPIEKNLDEGVCGALRIATDKSGGTHFNGYLNQMLLYRRALLDAEIQAINNRGVIQFQGAYGAAVTNTLAAGQIGDTPFQISSGTHKIVDDTIDGQRVKAIECVTSGVVYAPVQALGIQSEEGAYGTYEWWLWKETAGTTSEILWCADEIGGASAASQDSYATIFGADESVSVAETINGMLQSPFVTSAAGFKPVQTWIGFKVTRSPSGNVYLYTRGIGNGNDYTEVGNSIDSTLATSKYICFNLNAGDKIVYGGINSRYSFTKNLTVQ